MQDIIENNTAAPVTGAYQTDAIRHGIKQHGIVELVEPPGDERFRPRGYAGV